MQFCACSAPRRYINGTMLDDRPIRVDFDWGFVEGRQFGRGRSGGQVRALPGRKGGGGGVATCVPRRRLEACRPGFA